MAKRQPRARTRASWVEPVDLLRWIYSLSDLGLGRASGCACAEDLQPRGVQTHRAAPTPSRLDLRPVPCPGPGARASPQSWPRAPPTDTTPERSTPLNPEIAMSTMSRRGGSSKAQAPEQISDDRTPGGRKKRQHFPKVRPLFLLKPRALFFFSVCALFFRAIRRNTASRHAQPRGTLSAPQEIVEQLEAEYLKLGEEAPYHGRRGLGCAAGPGRRRQELGRR